MIRLWVVRNDSNVCEHPWYFTTTSKAKYWVYVNWTTESRYYVAETIDVTYLEFETMMHDAYVDIEP